MKFLRGICQHARMRICDWTAFETELAALTLAIEVGRTAITPFPALALFDSPRLQRKVAARWAREECRPKRDLPPLRTPSAARQSACGLFFRRLSQSRGLSPRRGALRDPRPLALRAHRLLPGPGRPRRAACTAWSRRSTASLPSRRPIGRADCRPGAQPRDRHRGRSRRLHPTCAPAYLRCAPRRPR